MKLSAGDNKTDKLLLIEDEEVPSLFLFSFFFFVRSWQVVDTGIKNGEKVRDQNGTDF